METPAAPIVHVELVQCDYCNTMIPIDEFNDHVDMCEHLQVFSYGSIGANGWLATMMMMALGGDQEDVNEYEMWSELGDAIGKVEIGIDDVSTVLSQVHENEPLAHCPICLEDMSQRTEEKVMATSCGHIYCESRITRWLQKNVRCPVCMVDLKEKNSKSDVVQ